MTPIAKVKEAERLLFEAISEDEERQLRILFEYQAKTGEHGKVQCDPWKPRAGNVRVKSGRRQPSMGSRGAINSLDGYGPKDGR